MSTSIIPIKFNVSHSKRIEMTPDEIEELSFSDIPLQSDGTSLRITEADVEEFVRRNIQVLFPQDETLLIVGRQVVNKEGGRADLVALDDSGYIVLIELKRDASDMSLRKEALEFQAIRYAANYARIKEPQELIQKLFAPYIDKHRDEFGRKELTSDQLASEILKDFLTTNKIKDFNQKQRIVLVSSSFDSQTLSACAWLSKNNIDIRCLSILPIKYDNGYFLQVEQIIPPIDISDYFVEVAEPSQSKKKIATSIESSVKRENLPRMPKLFEWGILKAGDKVYIQGHPEEIAQVIDPSTVKFGNETMRFNDWGQIVTGWSSINIYEWTILASSDKTLDELRREKIEELAAQSA